MGKQFISVDLHPFILEKRAAKTGRNISKNTALGIPKHDISYFKPSKEFQSIIKERSS